MKKSDGTKIEIIRENPVAKALTGNCYRMQVKVSKKVYRRAAQKRNVMGFLKNGNDSMRSSALQAGGLMRSFPFPG